MNAKIKPNDIVYLKNSKNLQSLNINQMCNKRIIDNINPGEPLSLKNINQKVGIIIVARNSSNRFPKKALGDICLKEEN